MDNTEWILEQHRKLNHKYAGYLPYEFHLKLAEKVYCDYEHLLYNLPVSGLFVRLAVLGHDLLEDTHVSYNDVKDKLGYEVAEMIYAVTNEKGRTRDERANGKYYKGIRETNGAVFVKLCDRIANVRYSKMMEGNMLFKYRQENEKFLEQLGVTNELHNLYPMVRELKELFS